MPLPAHQLLHPACPIKPAWAVFDRGWYLTHHADARAICSNKPPEAALLYYLRAGARMGHSPSPLFDETWYLAQNPDIAELVRAGNYASGFDHYCQHGHRAVSPHWLFDDALYASLYEDMTLENLAQHQCHGRYDHYLRSGQRERRLGHFLFDGAYYRERAAEAGIPPEDVEAPYTHYLSRLGTAEELAPSVYFDPLWYAEHHPAAKAEIARGRYTSALHHYLTHPAPEHLDPVPQFSESFYRRRHPDIQAAIENGFYRSAYQQFVQYGAFELRQPSAEIDLAFYRDMHERVRNDLNAGTVRDAFAHLRLIGLVEGLACAPPDSKPTLSEHDTRELFLKKARSNLALFARRRLDFTCENPTLSVIMVLFNRFELTMLALASLRDNFPGAIELILIDNDSSDETRRLARYVTGAKILRNASNLGFLRACNQALAEVTAQAVLYLNNDVELAHGAVATALARLRSDPAIGAVGAKIIRTNGLLQEAGSIIWNEGTTIGYMRDASPLAPEANFLRAVDYCSAVFLLCRTAMVKKLGGFDEAFAPAYFEDADLCVRLIQSGAKIIYDPAIALTHLEFGSASTTEASMALMRRGKRIFKKKHKDFLAAQHTPSAAGLIAARGRGERPRVLFIEDTIPIRRLGSGFVRSNDIVHAIAAAGYEVHVFPINGTAQDVMSLFGELPETAEILHDQDFVSLPEFLAERKGIYDLIWLARTHNFTRVAPYLAKANIRAPIILDTEALASNRAPNADGLAAELAGTAICRTILCVNEAEAAQVRALPRHAGAGRHPRLSLKTHEPIPQTPDIIVLGTAIRPSPTPNAFSARAGLLFIGAMHQPDSPNLDALHWYRDAILPALTAELGAPPITRVAGYASPDIDLSDFAKDPRFVMHGCADDLTPLYNTARVFIAPTRIAAGTPYKLYEAAAAGLPAVATELLARQLGWKPGAELLAAADAVSFARQVAKLYGSEQLWKNLRKKSLARLDRENNVAAFNASVAEILKRAITAR